MIGGDAWPHGRDEVSHRILQRPELEAGELHVVVCLSQDLTVCHICMVGGETPEVLCLNQDSNPPRRTCLQATDPRQQILRHRLGHDAVVHDPLNERHLPHRLNLYMLARSTLSSRPR